MARVVWAGRVPETAVMVVSVAPAVPAALAVTAMPEPHPPHPGSPEVQAATAVTGLLAGRVGLAARQAKPPVQDSAGTLVTAGQEAPAVRPATLVTVVVGQTERPGITTAARAEPAAAAAWPARAAPAGRPEAKAPMTEASVLPERQRPVVTVVPVAKAGTATIPPSPAVTAAPAATQAPPAVAAPAVMAARALQVCPVPRSGPTQQETPAVPVARVAPEAMAVQGLQAGSTAMAATAVPVEPEVPAPMLESQPVSVSTAKPAVRAARAVQQVAAVPPVEVQAVPACPVRLDMAAPAEPAVLALRAVAVPPVTMRQFLAPTAKRAAPGAMAAQEELVVQLAPAVVELQVRQASAVQVAEAARADEAQPVWPAALPGAVVTLAASGVRVEPAVTVGPVLLRAPGAPAVTVAKVAPAAPVGLALITATISAPPVAPVVLGAPVALAVPPVKRGPAPVTPAPVCPAPAATVVAVVPAALVVTVAWRSSAPLVVLVGLVAPGAAGSP